MGRREMCKGFWWGNLRERDNSEDLGVGGRIILGGSSRSGLWGVDWIGLVQDRDRWRAIVNAVMNLRVQ
jgi:hypothetical protein